MLDYGPAFTAAREHGLGRTVHAGEGRPPEEIAVAIEVLHAQRIGHGTTLLDEPEVVDLVLDKGVIIEACPTSNVHTGAIGSLQEHPIARWLELGIAACICTDNTFFSCVDAPGELQAVAHAHGLRTDQVSELIEHGHRGAFSRS